MRQSESWQVLLKFEILQKLSGFTLIAVFNFLDEGMFVPLAAPVGGGGVQDISRRRIVRRSCCRPARPYRVLRKWDDLPLSPENTHMPPQFPHPNVKEGARSCLVCGKPMSTLLRSV